MRQRRQLGKRRANATMVSRLVAEPGGHWEKSSQRAIFPNVLQLPEGGDFEALTVYTYKRLFKDTKIFIKTSARLPVGAFTSLVETNSCGLLTFPHKLKMFCCCPDIFKFRLVYFEFLELFDVESLITESAIVVVHVVVVIL